MPIFEATGSSDPLGLWDTAPQAVSFGMGDEDTSVTAAPVYRVNLPESMAASSSALAENLASFERMNAALDDVPSQLDGLVQRMQEKQRQAAPGVSFAVADLAPETGPESELLSLLSMSDSAALGGVGPEVGPEGVSFGLIEQASGALGQAKEKLETLLEQVNHDILHFAWVETKIAGQIIARTEVGWSGDSTTVWTEATSAEQILLHQRTLKVVSQTRHLKLRLLLTITGGAARVAPLMATPGGAVLALPAVYQYVTKILEQVKQLQSIQSPSIQSQ